MADPRDTARTWLAEQICASAVEAGGRALDPPCGSCRRRADVILNVPGVEVVEQQVRYMGAGWGFLITNNPTHTQVVIRLPAQSVGDPP